MDPCRLFVGYGGFSALEIDFIAELNKSGTGCYWTCGGCDQSFDCARNLLFHLISSSTCSLLSEKQKCNQIEEFPLGSKFAVLAAVDYDGYKDQIETFVLKWEASHGSYFIPSQGLLSRKSSHEHCGRMRLKRKCTNICQPGQKGELAAIDIRQPNDESPSSQPADDDSDITNSEKPQLKDSESEVNRHGFPMQAPIVLKKSEKSTYLDCLSRLNTMDPLIEKHRGTGTRLSNNGGEAVKDEWNKENAGKSRSWGPYKTYASLVSKRAKDINTLKGYLKQAGYVVGSTAGCGTAGINTGSSDEDQGGNEEQEADKDQGTIEYRGSDRDLAEEYETADEYQDTDFEADGDDMEDVEM